MLIKMYALPTGFGSTEPTSTLFTLNIGISLIPMTSSLISEVKSNVEDSLSSFFVFSLNYLILLSWWSASGFIFMRPLALLGLTSTFG